ncbi:hypothetical protein, partial [Citricoccus nitrophenolicus]|uniref:hypothetical protein n=1 Tax=Citricoccus nitrophenolicus TaxID=863575 RepID=UPI0031EF5E3D
GGQRGTALARRLGAVADATLRAVARCVGALRCILTAPTGLGGVLSALTGGGGSAGRARPCSAVGAGPSAGGAPALPRPVAGWWLAPR